MSTSVWKLMRGLGRRDRYETTQPKGGIVCICGHAVTHHLDEPGYGRTVCQPPCRCIRYSSVTSERGQALLKERGAL